MLLPYRLRERNVAGNLKNIIAYIKRSNCLIAGRHSKIATNGHRLAM